MRMAALPKSTIRGSSRSICERSSMPASSAAPIHSADPSVLSAAKRASLMWVAPASGGAIIDSPGTNLAMIRALTPQRSKLLCVWLTQISGVSEMRHSSFMTRPPLRRPAAYQVASPMMQASSAAANTPAAGRRPAAASAPANSSAGRAGTGRPSCSSSTLPKIRPTPSEPPMSRSCAGRCACANCAAVGAVTVSTGILGEDRGDRGVDALLRVRAAGSGEILVHRCMPQRLVAAGVIQIHRNDALRVHVRPRVAPAPVTVVAPAGAVGPVHHAGHADAVAEQAVGVPGSVLDRALHVRGDRGAQTALVNGIGNGTAQRAVAAERARPGERVAADLPDERGVDVGFHIESRARGDNACECGNEQGAQRVPDYHDPYLTTGTS